MGHAATQVLSFGAFLAGDSEPIRAALGEVGSWERSNPGASGWIDRARHRLRLLDGAPSAVDPELRAGHAEWPLTAGTLWLIAREAIDAGAPEAAVSGLPAIADRSRTSHQVVLALAEGAARFDAKRWHDALAVAVERGLRLFAVDAGSRASLQAPHGRRASTSRSACSLPRNACAARPDTNGDSHVSSALSTTLAPHRSLRSATRPTAPSSRGPDWIGRGRGLRPTGSRGPQTSEPRVAQPHSNGAAGRRARGCGSDDPGDRRTSLRRAGDGEDAPDARVPEARCPHPGRARGRGDATELGLRAYHHVRADHAEQCRR